MTVFIEVEIVNRELPGISYLLNNTSISANVYVGTTDFCRKSYINFNSGIYILKSLSINDIDFIKDLKRNNFKIFLMPSEGVYSGNSEEWYSMIFPTKLLSYLDKIFVWGPDMFDYLSTQMNKEYLVKLGVPRFIFSSNQINNKNLSNKSILVCTNFSAAHPQMGKEAFRKYYLNEKTFTENYKSRLDAWIEERLKMSEEFIILINKLVKEGFSVTLRPHPSEDSNYYLKVFKVLKKLKIDKEQPLDKSILKSSYVIHCDSTVAIDALFLNTNVICFKPYDFSSSCSIVQDIGTQFKNSDEVLKFINTNTKSTFDNINQSSNLIYNYGYDQTAGIFWNNFQTLNETKTKYFSLLLSIIINYVKWTLKKTFFKKKYTNKIKKTGLNLKKNIK